PSSFPCKSAESSTTVTPTTHPTKYPSSTNTSSETYPLGTDHHDFATHNLCPDCAECEAKSEGLVCYPATQAPVSGSVTVTTQCAANAHTLNATSLNVTCSSDDSWSGQSPHCQCDEGYYEVTLNGTQICESEHKFTAVELILFTVMQSLFYYIPRCKFD
ncbi:hypothetical protein GBAR_LOCUS17473, partial [Geodia barretti]